MAGLKIVKNKSGAIFITVLLISMMMIFIAVSASNMLLQDAHMIRHLKYSAQARYLAEAGINDAIAVLLSNGFSAKDNAANFPRTQLDPGYYDVTVMQSGGRVLLSSEGEVQNVTRTVAVEIKSLYPEALNYALATGADIDIKAVQGSIDIKGNIHANGDMLLKEQGQSTTLSIEAWGTLSGKATASGSYSTSGNVTIEDAANSGGGEALFSFPSFNIASFKTVADGGGGVYYSSGQSFSGAALTGGTAGITFVDGDASFTGDCTITGGFVATGDITLNNGNSITQTHDDGNRFPIFISGGTCKLYGLFSTEGGNIVYATDGMKIRTPGGQSTVMGSVISGGWLDMVANNDLTLTYSRIEGSEIVPVGIEVVSWNR